MIHVLFVCLGNICRSPMAEAYFRDLVNKEKLDQQITVDSAGIGHWHAGEEPHQGTRDLLDDFKISYEGMKARQVQSRDWDDFDYIIAMDDQNKRDLKQIRMNDDSVVVAKLMDFVDNAKEKSVPDPYYTGNFDYTYDLISLGCRELLTSIKKDHNI